MRSSLTNYSHKSITNKDRVINISKGPQFNSRGGVYLAMIFVMFFITAIVFVVHAEFFASFILIILSILLFSFVIDIHGIEVNTESHKIRDYKAFLWFKFGEWSNLNDFKSIYLKQKNVMVGNSEYSEYSSDTYHYYHIKLVDELNKKEIILAEYKNYYKALNIATNIAHATRVEFKDMVKRTIKRK